MLESSGVFNIDGVQLEYQRLDPLPGSGLTLVFLHEGLGCVALWKDFPRRVAQLTGCQVLVYSRAGCGGSDPCPLPRPLSFMQDEGLRVLPKILAAAEIQKAILVGHSDGASIALINAGGAVDARIQGLILMAPHVFVEELTLNSICAARTAFETADLRERLSRYHGGNVDCAFLGWSQAWLDQDFLDWNLDPYLPAIKVPVLLLQGEQDPYGTLRQLDKITAQLPHPAERLLLSNCGHSPFHDRPAATLQAIADFVQARLNGVPGSN